jgi:threonine/homoserine efflux transporter RhtA
MQSKPTTTVGIVVLVITVIAQLGLSMKYFTQNDLVGGFIAFGTAIVWAIAASVWYKSVSKK